MCGVSVVVVAAGVAGKPSFAHSFALLEYFQDSPKGGECGDAEDGAPEHVGDEYGGGKRHDAEQEEDHHQHRVPKWYSLLITTGWNSPIIRNVQRPMARPSMWQDCRNCVMDDILLFDLEICGRGGSRGICGVRSRRGAAV